MNNAAARSQYIDLPGFREAEVNLNAKGKPSFWIFETVDPENERAFQLKNGKPWYRSACPYYEGYWLHGGIGSVQCRKCAALLPGLQWDCTCSKDPENCPIFKDELSIGDEVNQVMLPEVPLHE